MSTLLDDEPVNLYVSTTPTLIQSGGGNQIARKPLRIMANVENIKYEYLVAEFDNYVFQYTAEDNKKCMLSNIPKPMKIGLSLHIPPAEGTWEHKLEQINTIECDEFEKYPDIASTKKIVSKYLGSGTFSAVFGVKNYHEPVGNVTSMKKKERTYNEHGIEETFVYESEDVYTEIDDYPHTKRSRDDTEQTQYLKPDTYVMTDTQELEPNILDTTELIIKMFDNDDINRFITEWKNHKTSYTNNIIDIYLYGSIIDERGEEISKYILTRKYRVLNDLTTKRLNLSNKLSFITNLANFCESLSSDNKILCDLKSENVGFYIDDNNCIPVMIDYDTSTILGQEQLGALYDKHGRNCYIHIAKTYVPAFSDILYVQDIWTPDNKAKLLEIAKKISILGFVDIINTLFLEGIGVEYGNLSVLIQRLNYDRYKKNNSDKLFLHKESYEGSVDTIIHKSKMVFNSSHEHIKPHVRTIVRQLLSYSYNEIPTYAEISEEFKNVYSLATQPRKISGGDYNKYIKYTIKLENVKNAINNQK
jgi:hypothetical protein